jgi:hypothetical protein
MVFAAYSTSNLSSNQALPLLLLPFSYLLHFKKAPYDNHTNSPSTMSTIFPFPNTLTRAAWPVPYTPRSLAGPSPEAMDHCLRSAKAVSERLGTRRPDRTTPAYPEKNSSEQQRIRPSAVFARGVHYCVCTYCAIHSLYVMFDEG